MIGIRGWRPARSVEVLFELLGSQAGDGTRLEICGTIRREVSKVFAKFRRLRRQTCEVQVSGGFNPAIAIFEVALFRLLACSPMDLFHRKPSFASRWQRP